jgi:phosphoribosylaminoimidazolecarboxamide formyltransferase/IMP cyclohydrolase
MHEGFIPVRTTLFSVSNKIGLTSFAQELQDIIHNIKLLASGSTAKALAEKGITYTPLIEHTRFPECFGGSVKTLHPSITGGILFRRGLDDAEADQLGIQPIDLVVCNFYDFEKASRQDEVGMEQLTEYMDIGGSTLILSACKNFHNVAVVIDPNDYPTIIKELKENQGHISLNIRKKLAAKAINATADYEAVLAQEFSRRLIGEETQRLSLKQGMRLRNGENPDQYGWVFKFAGQQGIAHASLLSGNELSYNNFEDATTAYEAVQELQRLGLQHGVAIVAHGSICGYATGPNSVTSFQKAWLGDSKSASSIVLAVTSPISENFVPEIKDKSIELILAPIFSAGFIAWAKSEKPNLCLLQVPPGCKPTFLYKHISGGMLLQTPKSRLFPTRSETLFQQAINKVGVVTRKQPHPHQNGIFLFAIAAVNYARSNAIAVVREYAPGYYQVIGIGAGQSSHSDCLRRLAVPKAIDALKEDQNCDAKGILEKCILASDGCFPTEDSIRYAAENGIHYCIQPGGSENDPQVIHAADELGVCMIFTGDHYHSH